MKNKPKIDPFVKYESFNLPLDSDGWTVLNQPDNIYYVSASGSDDNDGMSPEKPFKTGSKAMSVLREGTADRVLFKRGDVFRETLSVSKGGRSHDSRMVISSYGDESLPMPLFLSPKGQGGLFLRASNIAICHLHFRAWWRDPSDPGFDESRSTDSPHGISAGYEDGDNMLFEGNRIEFFANNVTCEIWKFSRLKNLCFRRNVVNNCWNSNGHSSGIFVCGFDGVLVEENVFDHNGWHPEVNGAQKTMFNHNLYLQFANTGVSVKGNIITRASSHGIQNRSGGLLWNNLMTECGGGAFNRLLDSEIGFNVNLYGSSFNLSGDSIGGAGFSSHHAFGRNLFHDNLCALSEGVGAPGVYISAGTVDEHYGEEEKKAYPLYTKDTHPLKSEIYNNVNYNYGRGRDGSIFIRSEDNSSFSVYNNIFSENNENSKGMNMYNLGHVPDHISLKFRNNIYHSNILNEKTMGDIGGRWKTTFDDLKKRTGETGFIKDPMFSDPGRDLDKYANHIGLKNRVSFYESSLKQRKGNWNNDLTALSVNDWIRTGYNMTKLRQNNSSESPFVVKAMLYDTKTSQAIGQIDSDSSFTLDEGSGRYSVKVFLKNGKSARVSINGGTGKVVEQEGTSGKIYFNTDKAKIRVRIRPFSGENGSGTDGEVFEKSFYIKDKKSDNDFVVSPKVKSVRIWNIREQKAGREVKHGDVIKASTLPDQFSFVFEVDKMPEKGGLVSRVNGSGWHLERMPPLCALGDFESIQLKNGDNTIEAIVLLDASSGSKSPSGTMKMDITFIDDKAETSPIQDSLPSLVSIFFKESKKVIPIWNGNNKEIESVEIKFSDGSSKMYDFRN